MSQSAKAPPTLTTKIYKHGHFLFDIGGRNVFDDADDNGQRKTRK